MKPNCLGHAASAEMQLLKDQLIKLFEKYQASRRDIWTKLFRNPELSRAKCQIAHDTITGIITYEGHYSGLVEFLKSKQIANGIKSYTYNKLHYNVYDKRESQQKNLFGQPRKIVLPGESSRKSQLAEVFHQAIQLVQQQEKVLANEHTQTMPAPTYKG